MRWLRPLCVLFALPACRDATEIVLDIHTNIACSSLGPVSIALSHGQSFTTPLTVTSACSATGDIGTLVIVPSGAKDDVVFITVAADVNGTADCTTATPSPTCVIARHAVSFTPYQSVDVPIELDAACVGAICDPQSTCVNGTCVPE